MWWTKGLIPPGVHAGSSPLCVVGLCTRLKGDLSLSRKLHFLLAFALARKAVWAREMPELHFPELIKQKKVM